MVTAQMVTGPSQWLNNRRQMNILILCTGNSARSIIGEVLLRDRGRGRIATYSAGSQPKGAPHPGALRLLAARGHDIEGLASKSWDAFTGEQAPTIDVTITVCDNAAGESCPVFAGAPLRAHWGIADPAAMEGPAQDAAFARTYAELDARVSALLALALETMDSSSLKTALDQIGRMEGATHG